MAEQEFSAVLASAAEGDQFAFARIVDTYHDDMRRVCAFITRDQDLAEDAVQTAWSIAWRKLGSVREPSKLRPDVQGAIFAGEMPPAPEDLPG